MPDCAALAGLAPGELQRQIRHEIQLVLDTALRPLAAPLVQILLAPGGLLTPGPQGPTWRWAWLVPLVNSALGQPLPLAEVARLAGLVEVLEISSERQNPAPATSGLNPSPARYSGYHNLNQALHTLALGLLPGVLSRTGLAGFQTMLAQLELHRQEEVEQSLAEARGEEAYLVAVGRREAALAAGASRLTVLAALLSSAQSDSWYEWGYSLGVWVALLEQLELPWPVSPDLPARPFALLCAQVQLDQPARLEQFWQARDREGLRRLLHESGALTLLAGMGQEWENRQNQARLRLPQATWPVLKPLLDYFRQRFEAACTL